MPLFVWSAKPASNLQNGNEKVLHAHSCQAKRICVGQAVCKRGKKTLQTGSPHCGRSFSFALLQSETHKGEALGSVYPEAPPVGGKTKGTSHDPPWGSWNSLALLLHFTLYSKYTAVAPCRARRTSSCHSCLLSLSTRSPFHSAFSEQALLLHTVSQDQKASS